MKTHLNTIYILFMFIFSLKLKLFFDINLFAMYGNGMVDWIAIIEYNIKSLALSIWEMKLYPLLTSLMCMF
jgi:hypothetical protein